MKYVISNNFALKVLLLLLSRWFLIFRCGKVEDEDNLAIQSQLLDEVKIIQDMENIRIISVKEEIGNLSSGRGKQKIRPLGTELIGGIEYTIVPIPGGSPCTAVQVGGKWRTCCDLKIKNNTGTNINGVVLIGWQVLTGSPEVGRTGGNNTGYDGSGTGWRTTDGVNVDPSANGGWALWMRGINTDGSIFPTTFSQLRRICLQSDTGFSLSLCAGNFREYAGDECHLTAVTDTTQTYLESFLQPGGNNCWLPTSRSGPAPTARYNHTVVWTGSVMIIWGGTDGYYDTGGMYWP